MARATTATRVHKRSRDADVGKREQHEAAVTRRAPMLHRIDATPTLQACGYHIRATSTTGPWPATTCVGVNRTGVLAHTSPHGFLFVKSNARETSQTNRDSSASPQALGLIGSGGSGGRGVRSLHAQWGERCREGECTMTKRWHQV